MAGVKLSPSFRLRNGSLNAVRLRRVFDLFDSDGDGEITVAEISAALDRLGLTADIADLSTTLTHYIPPGAGGLRFDDFDALHRALGEAIEKADAVQSEKDDVAGDIDEEYDEDRDMREAFNVFDKDGDGHISAMELQTVLRKLGLNEAASMADVQEMICSVDSNSDGRIDFDEFKSMMQGISMWGV